MSLILLGILNSQVSGAAAGAYDLLETQVLGTTAASVTFTGLGSYTDYKHLQIRFTARGDASGENLGKLEFNSATTTYRAHYLRGTGSSVLSVDQSSTPYIRGISGSNAAADCFSGGIIDILDFSSSSKNTTVRALHGTTSPDDIYLTSFFWNSTAAVTSMQFTNTSGNLVSGSRFSLYGVR